MCLVAPASTGPSPHALPNALHLVALLSSPLGAAAATALASWALQDPSRASETFASHQCSTALSAVFARADDALLAPLAVVLERCTELTTKLAADEGFVAGVAARLSRAAAGFAADASVAATVALKALLHVSLAVVTVQRLSEVSGGRMTLVRALAELEGIRGVQASATLSHLVRCCMHAGGEVLV